MNQQIDPDQDERRTWYDGTIYMTARQFVARTWALYSGPGQAVERRACWATAEKKEPQGFTLTLGGVVYPITTTARRKQSRRRTEP